MTKPITVKAAKEALSNLQKLKPANEKFDDGLEMSVKETAFFMAADLIQMGKRGFTNRELSAGLAGQGIAIKPGTLNRYLNEYLAGKKGHEKSEPASKPADSESDKPNPKSQPDVSESSQRPTNPGSGTDHRPSTTPARNEPPSQIGRQSGMFGHKTPDTHGNPKPTLENPKADGFTGIVKSDSAAGFSSKAVAKPVDDSLI